MSISLQVKFPPLQGFLHVNCSRLFLLRVSKLLYVGFIRFRSRTIPLFYWVPDSWRHECLSREGRVQQQVLQGLKRLRQESEIFNSWARQYHIEFFYPSQKVTWIFWTIRNLYSFVSSFRKTVFHKVVRRSFSSSHNGSPSPCHAEFSSHKCYMKPLTERLRQKAELCPRFKWVEF